MRHWSVKLKQVCFVSKYYELWSFSYLSLAKLWAFKLLWNPIAKLTQTDVNNANPRIYPENVGQRYKGQRINGDIMWSCISVDKYQVWPRHWNARQFDASLQKFQKSRTLSKGFTKFCMYKIAVHQYSLQVLIEYALFEFHKGPSPNFGYT